MGEAICTAPLRIGCSKDFCGLADTSRLRIAMHKFDDVVEVRLEGAYDRWSGSYVHGCDRLVRVAPVAQGQQRQTNPANG
jgi:hypothetical protein